MLPHFTGRPVPMTARMHSTPQRPFPFSHPVSKSPLSPSTLPLGPANLTRLESTLYRLVDAYNEFIHLLERVCCCSAEAIHPLER
eukprot:5240576-Pyramimonas_sp.AAC.2